MLNKKDIIILIPLYKLTFTHSEIISLTRTLIVLEDYPICLVIPNKLKNEQILPDFINVKSDIKRVWFNDSYFDSIDGYNKLLLNKQFYQKFKKYKYLTICQLDVYIAQDTLINWAAKGFDYIGASWPKTDGEIFLNRLLTSFGKYDFIIKFLSILNRKVFGKKDYLIGNGGLSLRNIRKSIIALNLLKRIINRFDLNEDVIWGIVVPLFYPFFRVPNLADGLEFAIEKNFENYHELNNDKRLLGYHALEKYNPVLWNAIIANNK